MYLASGNQSEIEMISRIHGGDNQKIDLSLLTWSRELQSFLMISLDSCHIISMVSFIYP